jgi:hypothetical protein
VTFVLTSGCKNEYELVAMEEFNPDKKNKVPIPNVCRTFEVECINIFSVLRELKAFQRFFDDVI